MTTMRTFQTAELDRSELVYLEFVHLGESESGETTAEAAETRARAVVRALSCDGRDDKAETIISDIARLFALDVGQPEFDTRRGRVRGPLDFGVLTLLHSMLVWQSIAEIGCYRIEVQAIVHDGRYGDRGSPGVDILAAPTAHGEDARMWVSNDPLQPVTKLGRVYWIDR